jgi:hypothetical protein
MPRIEVQPDLLSAGGARQSALAAHLQELSTQLRSTTAGAAAATGECGASSSISFFGHAWSSALDVLADTVGVRGSNLGAAAGAYLATDRAVVRRPAP